MYYEVWHKLSDLVKFETTIYSLLLMQLLKFSYMMVDELRKESAQVTCKPRLLFLRFCISLQL